MGCASSAGTSDGGTPDKLHDLRLFLNEFRMGEVFDEGSFGQVFVARPIRRHFSSDDGRAVSTVARPISCDCLVKTSDRRARSRDFEKEVSIQTQVGAHPNVVRMLGHFQAGSRCYIVLERCRCSLPNLFESEPPAHESEMAGLFRQMLLAIAHVHGCGVVHRDIQPRNFLLGGPDGRDVQLTEFGSATRLPSAVSWGRMGALEYAAPEVLRGDVYDSNADVWSFGVTAYLMLYGDLPYEAQIRRYWQDADDQTLMELAVLAGVPAPTCSMAREHALMGAQRRLGWSPSGEAAEFVRAALVREPTVRKSASDFLVMPPLALPWLAVAAPGPDDQKPTGPWSRR